MTNALAPDKLGGLERYVRELAAALVRAGVDVAVVAKRVLPHSPDVETGADGVRLIRHDIPSKDSKSFALQYPWRTWRSIRSILDEHPHALLHGHFPLPMMTLVKPYAPAPRPFLYTLHAPVHKELLAERQGTYVLPELVQKPVVNTLRRVEASVVKRAAGVAVLSEFMRTQVAELSSRAAAEATLVPGGVDTGWFRPGGGPVDDFGDALLFTARRLTPRTGVTELVAAMASVVERHPRAKLAIAGDGHLRPRIEADIVAHGLEKNVELLGRVSEEELRSWYRSATLTVMPTTELEGFGLTTAESLLCGTPVLVTPIGANPELVRHMDPRFVTPGADRIGIARGIIDLLDAPDVLSQARRSLPGDLPRRWSWDAVAAKHIELYESRLGGFR
ncbi:glycosyltransferase family 4 protein [Actinoplanes sp. N902-109]|uniref:glycosyltransferase family 4 protein n=1 Tax=Actinoplanes sp. (strain N902-109) TaxID=649831 RepID=UPI0003A3FF52|nr:glycosyltransferase family 4 protein [Actinoplanes sp. N902-109]